MPEAIFCIGIAASGKTTWAHQQKGYIVLDSDQLRLELWGSETDQRDPHKVFDLMYKRGRAYLLEDKSVIFCSTNLSMKYRMHAIHQLANIPNIKFRAVVFNTPLDICALNNKKRERQVPDWLFEKQVRQFQPPVENEGWDSIEVVNRYYDIYGACLDDNAATYALQIAKKVDQFGSQQNIHHSLSLSEHCAICGNIALHNGASYDLIRAAMYHDIGKAYTATRWNGKKDDGQLHYPNHAEYGAYLALNMGEHYKVVQLIAYHMIPYMDATAQKTWRTRLGEEFWKEIMLLHNYDEAAH